MASITISLDEAFNDRLQMQAASHGRSVEEEAREILRDALGAEEQPKEGLGTALRRHAEKFGGLDLQLPPRGSARRPTDFDE